MGGAATKGVGPPTPFSFVLFFGGWETSDGRAVAAPGGRLAAVLDTAEDGWVVAIPPFPSRPAFYFLFFCIMKHGRGGVASLLFFTILFLKKKTFAGRFFFSSKMGQKRGGAA